MKKKIILSVLTAIILTLSGCGGQVQQSGQEDMIVSAESTGTEETMESSMEETADSKETMESSPEETEGTEETKESPVASTQEKESQASGSTKTDKPTTTKEGSTTAASSSVANTNAGRSSGATTGGSTTGNNSTNNNANSNTQGSNPASHTSCTWNGGSITTAATCKSAGVKTYTCTICGKTKTEATAKASHNYITDTTAATCTEVGKEKTYCSICGDVQSEKTGAAATGHNLVDEYTFGNTPPTCEKGSNVYSVCSTCGHVEGGNRAVAALGHDFVLTGEEIGNCKTDTIKTYNCSRCGETKHERVPGPAVHSWEWSKINEWDDTLSERCSICGIWK